MGLFYKGVPRVFVLCLFGMGFSNLCGCVSTTEPISNSRLMDGVKAGGTSILNLRISKYSQLSKEFPEEPKYHERLARLYWSQKKHRAAFTHLSAARKLDPENAKYDFIEGRIHVGIGNYTGAEKAYKAMIAKTPEGFAGPTYELGFLYLGIGREAEAKTMFERALEIDPSLSEPHYQLGNIWARKDEKRAIYHYEEYLHLGGVGYQQDALRQLARLQPELRRYNP